MLTLRLKKTECTGCNLCAEVAPNYWKMNDDGLAEFIHPTRSDKLFQYAEGFLEDRDILNQAETGCPVNIIEIKAANS